MPTKTIERVPAHEHQWVAMCWYEDGSIALYRCDRVARCIATKVSKHRGKGLDASS